MNLIKKSKRIFIILLASSAFASPAFASCKGGGNTIEKVNKYKTSQTVAFIDFTINYLNNNDDSNKRHLKSFSKCKKIFDSRKKSVRGIEILDLKKCKNLMNHKDYALLKTANLSTKKINIGVINDETKSSNFSGKNISKYSI